MRAFLLIIFILYLPLLHSTLFEDTLRITDEESNFFPTNLTNNSNFGVSMTSLGDLNLDGVPDIAVGAERAISDNNIVFGGVYILFMNQNGTVKNHTKITNSTNNFFPQGLDENDRFGSSVTTIGDLNGDGIPDMAVGARQDEMSGGERSGAVYILFMNQNGTVKNHTKIANSTSNFFPQGLDNIDQFGSAVEDLGDLDGDSIPDIAVGAYTDESENTIYAGEGAVYILFMNQNGTVKNHTKISENISGFNSANLGEFGLFGSAIENLGDLDQDGITDLAVGARAAWRNNNNEGIVYILFMNQNGTVKNFTEISSGNNGFFPNNLDENDRFGVDIELFEDLDGDGVPELLVGALQDEVISDQDGAIYLLYLNRNGGVKSHIKIGTSLEGLILSEIELGDKFGTSLTKYRDLNGDGIDELFVGAAYDENLFSDQGAIYLLFSNTTSFSTSTTQLLFNSYGMFSVIITIIILFKFLV